jgi:hypothetical protein
MNYFQNQTGKIDAKCLIKTAWIRDEKFVAVTPQAEFTPFRVNSLQSRTAAMQSRSMALSSQTSAAQIDINSVFSLMLPIMIVTTMITVMGKTIESINNGKKFSELIEAS